MSSSLPSYLTSGASSRNHHALLVALHEARSIQEEQAIVVKEVERCREVLRSKRLSTVSSYIHVPGSCFVIETEPSTLIV